MFEGFALHHIATPEATIRCRIGGSGPPLLLLHGEADRVCPPRGSRAFHAQLQGAGHRLRLYPMLRHEIMNEPEQEQVFEDLLAWVLEREA